MSSALVPAAAADAHESTDNAFHEMTRQLIEASVQAWPEDQLLPIALTQWSALKPADAVALFESHFGQYAGRLANNDTEALFAIGEHPALAALEIKAKYEGASATTRETLWVYIGHMCRFANMKSLYKHIPTDIFAAVTDAAKDLKAKLESGETAADAINPMELGQQLMTKFKPEDMERMIKGFMSSPDAMASLTSTVTQLQGAGASGLQGLGPLMQMFGRPT